MDGRPARIAENVELAQGWGPTGMWDSLERWYAIWRAHEFYRVEKKSWAETGTRAYPAKSWNQKWIRISEDE